MCTYFLQSRVQWRSSHHTVQLFSCPFHSSLPSLEQHLLLFSYRIMFKYKLGTEDLGRHCYSLVWRFLSEPIIIMITIIMTMYLTYCERDVKHVSLSIIFSYPPPLNSYIDSTVLQVSWTWFQRTITWLLHIIRHNLTKRIIFSKQKRWDNVSYILSEPWHTWEKSFNTDKDSYYHSEMFKKIKLNKNLKIIKKKDHLRCVTPLYHLRVMDFFSNKHWTSTT